MVTVPATSIRVSEAQRVHQDSPTRKQVQSLLFSLPRAGDPSPNLAPCAEPRRQGLAMQGAARGPGAKRWRGYREDVTGSPREKKF